MTTTTTTTTTTGIVKISKEKAQELFEGLRRQIVTGNDDAIVAYLSEMSRLAANARRIGLFRRWSARNYMFLAAQARWLHESHLGLYAGAAQWARIDRSVRPGSRPKLIWAYVPPAAAKTDDDAQGATPTASADTAKASKSARPTPTQRRRPAFRLVEVFDWSDTVSDDPDFVEPNWATPLAAGDAGTLSQLIASSPVPVTLTDLGGSSANGWLDRSGITVNSAMPIGNQISTLAHELTHHQLGHLDLIAETRHGGDQGDVRIRCEQEAGLGQWLVLKQLGLDETVGNDITASAAAYLRSWSDPDTGEQIAGHKRRGKLLDARLDAALAAADAIVERFCLAGISAGAGSTVTAR
jgi:hypothetical protein